MTTRATAFSRALALAALVGGAVALRIVERGEAWSPRTLAVVALFAGGAFFGTLAGEAIVAFLRHRDPLRLGTRLGLAREGRAGVLAGLLAVGGTFAAVLAGFWVLRNLDSALWSLRNEPFHAFLIHSFVGLTIDTVGAFAVTARPYLLPWPILVLGFGAAVLFAPARRRAVIAALALTIVLGVGIGGAFAQETEWTREKCARYTSAWEEAQRRIGTDGLSEDFLASHEAFIASGCLARADVCPRTEAELAMANIMVVMAMNAGMASTFPPFACRN